jgi:hypothetical protein
LLVPDRQQNRIHQGGIYRDVFLSSGVLWEEKFGDLRGRLTTISSSRSGIAGDSKQQIGR